MLILKMWDFQTLFNDRIFLWNDTTPLLELVFTCQWGPVALTWVQFHKKCSICNWHVFENDVVNMTTKIHHDIKKCSICNWNVFENYLYHMQKITTLVVHRQINSSSSSWVSDSWCPAASTRPSAVTMCSWMGNIILVAITETTVLVSYI